MRTAGPNNLGSPVKGKYLVLWNADVIRTDGEWHYVFDFDVRNSLEKSEISRLMASDGESTRYENKADWRSFLGGAYEVITGPRRNQIVKDADKASPSGTVKISCLRVGSSPFPLPHFS
jgi:hypothetical protein